MASRLIIPEPSFFYGYLDALTEHRDLSSEPQHFQMLIDNFPTFVLDGLVREAKPESAARTYWLVNEDEYIGTVQIRKVPSARHPNIKSHIYYEVRPSKRRQGHGREAFALGVEKLRMMNLKRIIVSCDSANIASRKIIEQSGATLKRKETVPDRDGPVLMYCLELTSSHGYQWRSSNGIATAGA